MSEDDKEILARIGQLAGMYFHLKITLPSVQADSCHRSD
jgi:hypothetical protein